jgi:hypothetical protein
MAGIYRQRHPERTVFYRVLFHYFDEFVAEYENRFEREYGCFRSVIQEVVEKYLDCGNPKCGFARIRCGDCGSEFLLHYKGQVMIRYYGLYANAHRGKKRKTGDDPSHPPIIDDEVSFMPSKGWAEMIRKVFEVDPLLCPSCGGKMSIIAFIADH